LRIYKDEGWGSRTRAEGRDLMSMEKESLKMTESEFSKAEIDAMGE